MDNLKIFLANNYSLSQARKRLLVLRAFLSKRFFNSLDNTNISEQDLAWLNSLGEDFYKNFNKLNVYQMLGLLEKELNQIQVLTIYIAFDMPEDQLDQLGVWLRTNTKPNILFEIKHDPNLMAGSALSWKGIYKDYSIKLRIDQNRDAILASFKSFLK